MGVLTSHNTQHQRTSPPHATVATLFDQNSKVDLADAEGMMAPKRTTDRGLRVLVWNKQDQVAHCVFDLTQDSGGEYHSQVGLSALPISEGRMLISRDDIRGSRLVFGETQHV
jgi:hypothetical protein